MDEFISSQKNTLGISDFLQNVKSFYKNSLKKNNKLVDIYISTKLEAIEITAATSAMTVCLINSNFMFTY